MDATRRCEAERIALVCFEPVSCPVRAPPLLRPPWRPRPLPQSSFPVAIRASELPPRIPGQTPKSRRVNPALIVSAPFHLLINAERSRHQVSRQPPAPRAPASKAPRAMLPNAGPRTATRAPNPIAGATPKLAGCIPGPGPLPYQRAARGGRVRDSPPPQPQRQSSQRLVRRLYVST